MLDVERITPLGQSDHVGVAWNLMIKLDDNVTDLVVNYDF